jgi:hypothetical protein
MKVILPYNVMVIANGDFFVEGLKPGDLVRGYSYNAKKIVNMALTSVTKLEPMETVCLKCKELKFLFFGNQTKVLSLGGPGRCNAVPFLLSVCAKNPRKLNSYPIIFTERDKIVPMYQLEWENDDYYLWAEGILVGSSS